MFVTVGTDDIHVTGSTDGEATAGADILAGTAGLLRGRVLAAKGPGPGNGQLISPVLGSAETTEGLGRLGNGPADLGIIVNDQATPLRLFLEAAIMVGAASAGILD